MKSFRRKTKLFELFKFSASKLDVIPEEGTSSRRFLPAIPWIADDLPWYRCYRNNYGADKYDVDYEGDGNYASEDYGNENCADDDYDAAGCGYDDDYDDYGDDYEETSFVQPTGGDRQPEMVGMAVAMDDHERKIVIEFCHLLEKSKQLFNGLRDLPQYGHKQWQSYFGRTFDVYTKLWKFQQQHRVVLDCKYGLKRWQIGEIASKIGQLYYHFYLRTSESAYLNEAYSFYYAIRGRAYYTRASKEDRCDLMVKKLRYYARFIVVCLLLKKMKLLRELITELDRQIIDYGNTYDPQDQMEWTVVVEEIKSFVHADSIVTVLHGDSNSIILSHRLTSQTTPPVEKSSMMNFSLHEIVIIGSCADQVKFSELTMDMFRIIQTLEREPSDDIHHQHDGSPRSRGFPLTPGASCSRGYLESGVRRENPHKYLLYKPSLNQVLVYLASGCKDLPPNGALLLYISADGSFSTVKHPEDHKKLQKSKSKLPKEDSTQSSDYNKVGYDLGGVVTNSKREPSRENYRDGKKSLSFKEVHCLYPGDLEPFTRRPLFIIVESDNSFVFQNIPRRFGQPLAILMSPLDLPQPFQDQQHQGSLFTLFLHSPLTAFCYCCDISSIPVNLWEKSQCYIDKFMAEASKSIIRSRIDTTYIQFFGDDFLRLLILRFVFCEIVLRMHRFFDSRTHRPKASPPLPEAEILENPTLIQIIFDLAIHLDVRSYFSEVDTSAAAAGPPPAKE